MKGHRDAYTDGHAAQVTKIGRCRPEKNGTKANHEPAEIASNVLHAAVGWEWQVYIPLNAMTRAVFMVHCHLNNRPKYEIQFTNFHALLFGHISSIGTRTYNAQAQIHRTQEAF